MSEGVRYHTGRFPPKELDRARFERVNSEAQLGLGNYRGLLKHMINPEVLLTPLKLKEATLSCAIEGTVVSLGEVLAYEGGAITLKNEPQKKGDIREVRNYGRALQISIDLMSKRPLITKGTITVQGQEITVGGEEITVDQNVLLTDALASIKTTVGGDFDYELSEKTGMITFTDSSAITLGDTKDTSNFLKAHGLFDNGTKSVTNVPKRNLAICGTVLKEAHKVLLEGTRGKDKAPGNFRTRQNYIGGIGTEDTADFVPIHTEKLVDGMKEWESYVNDPDQPNKLIQLAIAHAEFESLHPFLDGNGRLGRMLIPLFMVESNLLPTPTFYLSEFFEENRREYFDRLREVSRSDDWTGWCEFFLKAIAVQVDRNTTKAEAIIDLYKEKKEWMRNGVALKDFVLALDFLFQAVDFNTKAFIEKTGLNQVTARNFLVECL